MRCWYALLLVLAICIGCAAVAARPIAVDHETGDVDLTPSLEVEQYQRQIDTTTEREFTETKIKTENTETINQHERIETVTKEIVEPVPYRWIRVRCTAYDPGPCCCSPSTGRTFTGRNAWGTQGVAVDRKIIALGSHLDIPGYGDWIIADDTGSRVKGNHIDIRVPTHFEAVKFGVKTLRVRVWDK